MIQPLATSQAVTAVRAAAWRRGWQVDAWEFSEVELGVVDAGLGPVQQARSGAGDVDVGGAGIAVWPSWLLSAVPARTRDLHLARIRTSYPWLGPLIPGWGQILSD